MKKNIAYYLEDPERLSEISLHELNKWVEEMPYSQPLRLLVDLKSDQFVSSVDEDSTRYGTYFAEDYEPLSVKKNKEKTEPILAEVDEDIAPLTVGVSNQADRNDGIIDKIVESEVLTANDAINALTNEIVSTNEEAINEIEDTDIAEVVELKTEVEAEELPVLTHSLVDDMSEDLLEEDLLEVNPNVVLVNEISHADADEILEGELENEVLEVTEKEIEEVIVQYVEADSETDIEEEAKEEIVEEDILGADQKGQ